MATKKKAAPKSDYDMPMKGKMPMKGMPMKKGMAKK